MLRFLRFYNNDYNFCSILLFEKIPVPRISEAKGKSSENIQFRKVFRLKVCTFVIRPVFCISCRDFFLFPVINSSVTR